MIDLIIYGYISCYLLIEILYLSKYETKQILNVNGGYGPKYYYEYYSFFSVLVSKVDYLENDKYKILWFFVRVALIPFILLFNLKDWFKGK